MVSAARTEGPGLISRELVLPPQSFEAAEQTPVSELKEHRADWFALSCPHRLYRSLQPEGTQQVEVDGYEGDSWEKALFGKGRQVPGERKGLAPLGQGWLMRADMPPDSLSIWKGTRLLPACPSVFILTLNLGSLPLLFK